MEEYLHSEPVPIPSVDWKVRCTWLLLGCFCLLVGSVHLYTVDLLSGVDATQGQKVLVSVDDEL